MRRFPFLLSLVLLIPCLAFAQEPKPDDAKPADKKEEKKEEADKPKEPEKEPDEKRDETKPVTALPKPVKLRFHVTTTGTSYTDRQDWPHELSVFFAVNTGFRDPARTLAYYCQNYVVNGFGGWLLRAYRSPEGVTSDLAWAVASLVAGVGLLIYGRYFLKKLKHVSYL